MHTDMEVLMRMDSTAVHMKTLTICTFGRKRVFYTVGLVKKFPISLYKQNFENGADV